jgi:hypothetical protein
MDKNINKFIMVFRGREIEENKRRYGGFHN